MNGRKEAVILFVFIVVFIVYVFFSVQAERAYMIYESELNQLEQNLITLEEHNRSKQTLLMKQEKQLQEAEKQLKIANEQIKKSQELNKETQKSLESANQSLKTYEKEVKHKIRVKTRQRNMWILISAGLAYLAVR